MDHLHPVKSFIRLVAKYT